MRVPFFMPYLRFLCDHHTNPGLTILPDFAELCIEFWNLLQSSLLRKNTKNDRLNCQVLTWQKTFNDFKTRRAHFDTFFSHKKLNATDQN